MITFRMFRKLFHPSPGLLCLLNGSKNKSYFSILHRRKNMLKPDNIFLRRNPPLLQQSKNVFIRVQETPNPMTLLFSPGEKILDGSGRTYEFTSASSAKQSPLAM